MEEYYNLEVSNEKHDERVSITPSGFFGNSLENIQSRENFMTEEERSKVLDFARNIKFWDYSESVHNEDGITTYDADFWADRVANYNTIMKHENGEDIIAIIENLVARLKVHVDDFFKVDASPTSPAIVRWLPGQEQRPHADKELHEHGEEGPNDFPYYDISGLFYLNDDYEGGELYFPQHDIKFKPKPGGAYFFPGDKNYLHGVSQITSGTRYVLPFFWTVLEHKR
jgi:predicted 2-oxoglutarate/Fe(II)-dependent dioxygenase YbiX